MSGTDEADGPNSEDGSNRHAPARRLDLAFGLLEDLPASSYVNCLRRSVTPESLPEVMVERLTQVRWLQTDEHPLTWIDPAHHLRAHQGWIDACEGPDRIGRARVRTCRPLEPFDGGEPGPVGWYEVTIFDLTGVLGVDVVIVAWQPTEAEVPEEPARSEVTPAPSWFLGTTSFRLRISLDNLIEGGTLNVADVLGRPLADLLGKPVRDLLHPDDLDEARAAWQRLTANPHHTAHVRARMQMPDGSWRWFDSTSWNVVEPPHDRVVIAEFHDVNDQIEAEQASLAKEQAQERLARVFDEVDDVVMVGCLGKPLVYLNLTATRVFDYQALETPFLHQLSPDLRSFAGSVIVPKLRKLERWTGDVEIWVDGSPRTMATTVTPVTETGEDEIYYGVIMRDVTAERSHARALASQARLDPLTGLPNRLALMEHLERIRTSGAPEGVVSVSFIDLDNLKIVNDGLGHSAGDRLLQAVGAQLLKQTGLVARFGGDEFVVVHEDLAPDDVTAATEELLSAIRQVQVSGVASHVTASVGVAACRREQLDPEAIIRDADAAMYVAKGSGRARVVLFDEAVRSHVARRFVMESSLRDALAHRDLDLHFQPIVQLSTGVTDGFEALARWDAALPTEFVPVAEESGLIVPLGLWALRNALAGLAEMNGLGPDMATLRVGVNVSGHQLVDPAFAKHVFTSLDEYGVSPTRLVLELTESVLIDPGDEIDGVLRGFRDAGIHLALDDFGSGYSSLGYLRRYPIDLLKLDNSYTQALLHDTDTKVIVEAVVTMAERLGMLVVAEGVETPAQLEAVREVGIERAQGFLLGPPAPLADAVARLADHGPARYSALGATGFR